MMKSACGPKYSILFKPTSFLHKYCNLIYVYRLMDALFNLFGLATRVRIKGGYGRTDIWRTGGRMDMWRTDGRTDGRICGGRTDGRITLFVPKCHLRGVRIKGGYGRTDIWRTGGRMDMWRTDGRTDGRICGGRTDGRITLFVPKCHLRVIFAFYPLCKLCF